MGFLRTLDQRANVERAKFSRALELSRYRSSQGHHTLPRQLIEMIALRLLRGIGPEYYHTASFWNRETPWQEKLGHMGAAEYSRFIDSFNKPNFQKVSQHKVTEKALLSLFSIPTPRFIGYFNPSSGRDRNGNDLKTVESLRDVLARTECGKICFKRPEGWAGRSFQAAEIVRDQSPLMLRPLNRPEPVSVDDYARTDLRFDRDCKWLIEEYCEQHAWYKGLHPSSLNTMRLWAIRKTEGARAEVIAGYLRMGQRGALVDNRQAGGLVARIDVQRGGVVGCVVDGLGGEWSSSCHPETKANVEGEQLPYWNEAVSLAADALSVFPNMRFAGVDVAVSPDGPMIIELNVKPSMIGAAITGTPLRKVLRA